MEAENLTDYLDRPHFSIAMAGIAGALAFTVYAALLHGGGSSLLVTTPFDGGNLSTDIGTDVRINFYIRNTGERTLKVYRNSLELRFDKEWSFWSRKGFSSRKTNSISTETSDKILKIESGDYKTVKAVFTTPLDKGVFNLTLTGKTGRGSFKKKVKVVVENKTLRR